jgi:DNA-binding protein H-NS
VPKQNRKFNLAKMSLVELAHLRDDVETALASNIDAERAELQTKMDALSALQSKGSKGPNGVALPARRGGGRRAPLVAAKVKVHPLKGLKAAPKYRGPNGETWAGRGLAPRWLSALEKKGKKRDSFLIAT